MFSRLKHVLATVMIAMFIISCSTPKKSEAVLSAPTHLIVGEGMINPIGFYESKPRFSWKLVGNEQKQQSAYQIQVASSLSALTERPDLWDSNKRKSRDNAWQRYEGKLLTSRQKIYWRVRVWNESNDISRWSVPQTVELGLLSNTDWQASWIGHPDTLLTASPSQALIATPQYLRKSFTVRDKIASARLYITAKGLFKPFINGQTVSDSDVMTPGWTPYQHRIETLTYDVTELLSEGKNTLSASLAGGWYSGRIFNLIEKDHKLPPRLLAQLEVNYQNGEKQTVGTDETWLTTQKGPIRFASIYDGEQYNQYYEMPGWNDNNFDTSSWHEAITENLDEGIELKPKRHAPVRNTQRIKATQIVSVEGNTTVFDFGQNMVGVPIVTLPVIKDQTVTIRFAEALHKGEFYTENYRSAVSTDTFLPSKDGVINYQPTYTYHGYRYVEVSGFDDSKAVSKDWITAQVQHSDMVLYDNFHSSHDKLNKLSNNVVWGMRSNFFDIPLDCPQRDERLGWTGDAQVFVTPSMYMADTYGFWSAWLKSIREEQSSDGKIPLYVPYVEWLKFASSGWGDAVTIIPWELYQITGDKAILEDNFEMMKGWVEYHQKKSSGFISNMETFGDWLQPYPEATEKLKNRGDTDFSLIGTAYFARSVELTLSTAKVLNSRNDIERLTLLHEQVKSAFQKTFFDDELVVLKGKATQTSYLLGLAYGLFPDDKRELALEKLIEQIKLADNHLRTGFLGTPLLISVLQEAGRSNLIYELLFKETYPSWFYSINNGATTTWERWNSYSLEEGFNPEGMNSLNHYAYGTVSRWFYEGILGITSIEPGFKSVQIAPQFTEKLSNAKGSLKTPQGEIAVAWQIKNDQLSLQVSIPNNTKAVLSLPTISSITVDGVTLPSLTLNSGVYDIKGVVSLL